MATPAENEELNTDNSADTADTSSENIDDSSNKASTDSTDTSTAPAADTDTGAKANAETESEDKESEKSSEDKAPAATDDENDDDDLTDDESVKLDSKVKAKLSKKNREAANLRDRLGKESLRADRAEVALALGLDADAATLLAGATREAIEESAEKLLVLLGRKERVTPAGLPTEKAGKQASNAPSSEASLDDIGARMFKR